MWSSLTRRLELSFADRLSPQLRFVCLSSIQNAANLEIIMKSSLSKLSTVAMASVFVASMSLGLPKPAYAQRDLGAAILGGIVGGIIGGSINRCHSHGGYRHCHNHRGAHNHYRNGIIYVPAPRVYVPAPVYPAPGAYSQQHYNWCFNRYRSYDQRSNTYQPYGNVPRRLCRSPWG